MKYFCGDTYRDTGNKFMKFVRIKTYKYKL
jgi:hypothetical protein